MRRRRIDRGFLLAGLVTMMAIFGIMSGVAVQRWSTIEKREREAQLIYVQEQYAAAILAYQAEKGAYPTSLEQLGERGGNNQRFIRRLYTDPMLREATLEDWCVLNVNPTGQVRSSCATESDLTGLPGSSQGLRIGDSGGRNQSRAGQNQQAISGLQPGQTAIAGVHSKSRDAAFNTIKRGEDTYDRWLYTFEDYREEMDARGIPGVPTAPQQGGPAGSTGPGRRQPGQPGGQPGVGSGQQNDGAGNIGTGQQGGRRGRRNR